MNNLTDIVVLANELLDKEFTLTTALNGKRTISARSIGYVFEFDKAKRRLGCCHYIAKKITISAPLCKENLDKIYTKLTDTLLHEIAHAFSVYIYGERNGVGHNNFWRHIATQIGCNGERCYKSTEVTPVKSKYSLVCDNCGRTVARHKVTTKSIACGDCCRKYNNGKYTEKYKLKLVKNY